MTDKTWSLCKIKT